MCAYCPYNLEMKKIKVGYFFFVENIVLYSKVFLIHNSSFQGNDITNVYALEDF